MCRDRPLDHPRVRETNSRQAFNLGERSDAESLGSVVVCLKGSFVHHVGDGGVIVVDGFSSSPGDTFDAEWILLSSHRGSLLPVDESEGDWY